MGFYYYLYAGLRISSELSIPEWSMFEQFQPFENVEVNISLQNLLEQNWHLEKKLPFISTNDYRFHVHSIAYYQVQNGRTILVMPEYNANPQAVRFFLLSSAIGALFYQRGLLAIRASVLQVGKGIVAFCGMSNTSESIFIAYLVRHGYTMVSNDLCRFDIIENNQVSVWPTSPNFKHTIQDNRWQNNQQSLKLSSIYLIEWGEWNLTLLRGHKTLTRFIDSATYQPKLLEPMGILAAYLQFWAKIVSAVPIWNLELSKNPMTMNKNINLIEQHWFENKILESAKTHPIIKENHDSAKR